MNSRPLTFLYDDFDSGDPLRPIDFLRPLSKVGTPALCDYGEDIDPDDPDFIPNPSSRDRLLAQWKATQHQLDRFWTLWHEEYLLSLCERHRLCHKQAKGSVDLQPRIGDIVLIHDDMRSRGQWKMGKVVSIYPDHNDESVIRAADVLLPNRTIIKRPLNLLYPMELSEIQESKITGEDVSSEKDTPDPMEDNQPPTVTSPRRTHSGQTYGILLHPSILFIMTLL